MTNYYVLETLEQGAIWNIESVRLELHDPDPARPSTIARTQPDIVGIRKPDFEAAVWPEAIRIHKFGIKLVT